MFADGGYLKDCIDERTLKRSYWELFAIAIELQSSLSTSVRMKHSASRCLTKLPNRGDFYDTDHRHITSIFLGN